MQPVLARRNGFALFLGCAALLLIACGDESDNSPSPGQDVFEDVGEDVPAEDVSPDGAEDTDAEEDGAPDTAMDADTEDVDEEDPEDPGRLRRGCNPLAWEHDCFFPYPSDHFRVADDSLPGGYRVVIPEVAQVRRTNGQRVDLLSRWPVDGFSHHQPITAFFSEGVDDTSFAGFFDDPSATLLPTSPTLLMHAETGALIPHVAELDYLETNNPRRVLFLRPLVRLEFGERYIVGLQGLRAVDGSTIAPPSGFRALRAAGGWSNPAEEEVLAPVAARFDAEVLAPLRDQGVDTDELQLAWDFTVQTFEVVSRDMLTMRSLLLDALDDAAPTVTVTRVEEGDALPESQRGTIWRIIEGTFTAPLFTVNNGLAARLRRDASGEVVRGAPEVYAFTAVIPHSAREAAEAGEPGGVLQFGHGFFGGRAEVRGYPARLAAELGWMVIATDWAGMSTGDGGQTLITLSRNPEATFDFVERTHQGMANFIALGEAVARSLPGEEAFHSGEALVYDPTRLSFMGISQGHILGGTFVALSPRVERAILHVGGASFTLMMSRAAPFADFLTPIQRWTTDVVDTQKFVVLAAHAMDRIDPGTYAHLVRASTLPRGPEAREILMQVGRHDSQVPEIANYLHARMLGLPLLLPSALVPPLLETTDEPAASALAIFDGSLTSPPDPRSTLPARTNPVHDALRSRREVIEQIAGFLSDAGLVFPACGDEACVFDLN